MSQSLPIHVEQRKDFVTQQISNIESIFTKWTNEYIITEDTHLSSHSEEQITQTQTQQNIAHFQTFLSYLRDNTSNSSLLECHTLKSLQQHFDYMHQVLLNEIKLHTQRQTLKSNEKTDEKKGHKFSRKSNLILKNWLYKHFSFPYPTKEQTNQLAEKCNLTYKQIQIWFINARGRISNKSYEEKKFKNIVKSKYLSIKQLKQ